MSQGTHRNNPRHQFYWNKCTCTVCGKEFNSARSHTKTCSPKCRKALSRQDPDYIEPRAREKAVIQENSRRCVECLEYSDHAGLYCPRCDKKMRREKRGLYRE